MPNVQLKKTRVNQEISNYSNISILSNVLYRTTMRYIYVYMLCWCPWSRDFDLDLKLPSVVLSTFVIIVHSFFIYSQISSQFRILSQRNIVSFHKKPFSSMTEFKQIRNCKSIFFSPIYMQPVEMQCLSEQKKKLWLCYLKDVFSLHCF